MDAIAPTLALVGSPNCGKTSLFNALTGLNRKVANYPGVTVDWAEGFTRKQFGAEWKILDLPGVYSLRPQSDDELLTREIVCQEGRKPVKAELLLCVADANNLNLHLRLLLEVMELGQPTVLAVSMMDRAEKKGRVPDLALLESELGIPVRGISSIKNQGLEELMKTVGTIRAADQRPEKVGLPSDPEGRILYLEELLKRAQPLSDKALYSFSDTVDRWLLHRWIGPFVLALIFLLVFQAIYAWAKVPQDWIETGMEALSGGISERLPDSLWRSLLVDGVIHGVGSVVVFLPQILILFFFLLVLEYSGYMARAAFLLDRPMRLVGLNGRSVLPLISGFACAIPSLMSTRIIGHRLERVMTMLITPLMTCSARLPVYALLIGAFIPSRLVFGFLNLQGLVLFSLYVGGISSALTVAWIIQRMGWVGGKSSFVMELPAYHLPSFRNVASGLYERGQAFLMRAGTFIMAVVIVLWFLATFPRAPEGAALPNIYYSFAGKLGQFLEPVFAPLGWNWKLVVALIPGFAAREVLVGALGMVYAVETSIGDEQKLAALSSILPQEMNLPAAVALLVWYIYAPQCLATFAVMQKETKSWRITAMGFSYLLVLAYGAAWLAHRITAALL